MSGDPFAPHEGRVSVARVMDAVRDAVRRRREDPSTSAEAAVAERLAALADEPGIDPDLLAHLLSADGLWNVSPDYRVETHRKGIEARGVLLLKASFGPSFASIRIPSWCARHRSTSTCFERFEPF